ncbi:hypothetical protein COCNU_05G003330 [Cocos nucifera]|uniref:Uncharacterized protein n=1 Tax=Cocos nucifera TaxID=13894 RepID=A0A8K0N1D4_COCNU|nr:hypothetical protein COCNU_05G003330 [Cocos nucifera]
MMAKACSRFPSFTLTLMPLLHCFSCAVAAAAAGPTPTTGSGRRRNGKDELPHHSVHGRRRRISKVIKPGPGFEPDKAPNQWVSGPTVGSTVEPAVQCTREEEAEGGGSQGRRRQRGKGVKRTEEEEEEEAAEGGREPMEEEAEGGEGREEEEEAEG